MSLVLKPLLKFEGSNPGFDAYFSQNRLQSLDKNESTLLEFDRVESCNLDFRWQGRTMAIDLDCLSQFLKALYRLRFEALYRLHQRASRGTCLKNETD